MRYTTHYVAELFKVSDQTVKNWTKEFDDYLSASARPESGRQRQFTDDDLSVLALVSEMKGNGVTYESIHTSLQMGQRGIVPETHELAAASTTSGLLVLRQQVMILQGDLEKERLSSASKDGQISLLKEQLDKAQAEIRRLERDNARLSPGSKE